MLACKALKLLGWLLLGGAAGCAASSEPASPTGEVLPAGDKEWLVADNNDFALKLYAQLGQHPGNLFFSPASVWAALGMAHAGARERTAAQMAGVLYATASPGRLATAFPSLWEEWQDATDGLRGVQITLANALWGHKGYPWRDDFLHRARESRGAGLHEVDFGFPQGARRTINGWVAEQTRGLVKELIGQGVLTPLTRLVLANAIYFKGDWDTPFAKAATFEQAFHRPDGVQIKVPMMHSSAGHHLFENGELQVLELPYRGKDLSMLIALPRGRDALPGLEKALTTKRLRSWWEGLRRHKTVDVTLPRFKLVDGYTLDEALKGLGMTDAFDPKAADFSGMDGRKGWLYLAAVIHKAFVEVNEEGTEAAAATSAVMAVRSQPRPRPVFRADHPFLFLIRENRSGCILFLGRVCNPCS